MTGVPHKNHKPRPYSAGVWFPRLRLRQSACLAQRFIGPPQKLGWHKRASQHKPVMRRRRSASATVAAVSACQPCVLLLMCRPQRQGRCLRGRPLQNPYCLPSGTSFPRYSVSRSPHYMLLLDHDLVRPYRSMQMRKSQGHEQPSEAGMMKATKTAVA